MINIGYSNKISAGADKSPKFNTNINAYFGKLENKSQLEATQTLTDDGDSYMKQYKQIPKKKTIVINGLKGIDIQKKNLIVKLVQEQDLVKLAKLFRAQDCT